jgi:Hypothetical glycosyl hydrolase family 15
MDLGSAGYQDAWLANVKGELARNGWDGVMLDDTFSGENAVWHLGSRTMAEYPTAASYTAAVRSFLARVCPGLTSAGFIALPNIASTTPATWSDWVSLCSGALQEYWTKWGYDGTRQFSGADWDYRQQFLSLTENAGKIFLGVTYAPMNDVRSMRYARASFLLDWDGGPSALAFQPEVASQDPYSSEWAVDIGKPGGAKYKVGNAWRRDYDSGAVLVNPSATSAQTVSLGGDYVMPDGSHVTSVTLPAVSGLVLRSTATTVVPPGPPPPPPVTPTPPPPPPASPLPPAASSPPPPTTKKKKKRSATRLSPSASKLMRFSFVAIALRS